MTNLVFIQMSGPPGSGKTTIATAIAQHIEAVVIDHDITKTALLDAEVPISVAGHASYSVLGAVAQHLLKQGYSVIHDSPCLYDELLERGQQLAVDAGARYRYIECVVNDLKELDRRLRTRPRLRSQVRGLGIPSVDSTGGIQPLEDIVRNGIAKMKRPANGYLLLDATRPVEACVEEAVRYIKTGTTTSDDR
ncbi:MAG: AAA family ATPase [Candidatus Latescibacteria bacterium]|nr:AAA family ATPase [Candidatus Latescibacterota bacterium]